MPTLKPSMQRRTFLTGAALLPMLSLLGCQASAAELTIYLLDRSVPLRLVNGFRQRQSDKSLRFETEPTLAALYQQLLSWQEQAAAEESSTVDWITLGDYWLGGAIQQNLIQPVAAEDWASWQTLAPIWQQLVTRTPDGHPASSGKIWGVPYRWGSLMMIYQPKHWQGLNWRPQRWQDLIRPAAETGSSPLTGRIALPDHPHIVTGIALKLLNASANTPDISRVSDLQTTLETLHRQVRFYSSDHYLEPLLLEDISLAVGWSTDILPILQQYRQFEAVVPEEGTLLSADLWVRPASAAPSPTISRAAQDWIDYCLDPDVATELSIFSQGGSPRFWGRSEVDALPDSSLLLSPKLQQQSEFLLPLTEANQQQMQRVWRQIQTG